MADAGALARGRRARWPSSPGRWRSTAWSRPRRAASCSGPRWRWSSAPASCWRASPASCPIETVSAEYQLEYGAGQLELHTDALRAGRAGARPRRPARHRGHRGGAVRARGELGGEVVGCGFLVELAFLGGRERLAPARRPRPDHLRVLSFARAHRPPQPHDRRSRERAVGDRRDPHHLPRWWPRVTRVEDVEDGAFTEVMRTAEGQSRAGRLRPRQHRRAAPRACAGPSASRAPPSARVLRSRRDRGDACGEPAPGAAEGDRGDDRAAPVAERRSSPASAATWCAAPPSATIEEALDGLERISG